LTKPTGIGKFGVGVQIVRYRNAAGKRVSELKRVMGMMVENLSGIIIVRLEKAQDHLSNIIEQYYPWDKGRY
jgi:hypothetical protein